MGRRRWLYTALHAKGPITTRMPTYSSSPRPGGISRKRGVVIVVRGRRPARQRLNYWWALYEHSVILYLSFDVASVMSNCEKAVFPRICSFIAIFHALHMHVELCDWWRSSEMTSSGQFFYLSAGRSRVTSLLQNQSSRTVHIPPLSLSLSARTLARACTLEALTGGTALKASALWP